MDHQLWDQVQFVRGQTLKLMDGISETDADRLPEGFRNSLRWHFGHIYVVLERFAFRHLKLTEQYPEGYREAFETGTSPLDAPPGAKLPTLPELAERLSDQIVRIRAVLGDRLSERIDPPYVTGSGKSLATPEEFLSFNLYHEGMHIGIIKCYRRLLSIG